MKTYTKWLKKWLDENTEYVHETKIQKKVPEKLVQILWAQQKFLNAPLKTLNDIELIIFSPGAWNYGAGPDFLSAHIKIGEKELKGDIEIHLHPSQWYSHEHQLSALYDNVILHICLYNQDFSPQDNDNYPAHTVILEKFLTEPIEKLLADEQLIQNEKNRDLPAGRCSQEIFKNMNTNELNKFFSQMAVRRLKEKADKLQRLGKDIPTQFRHGISGALGYKHNHFCFQKLSKIIAKYPLFSFDEKYSLAMGISGLFHCKAATDWKQHQRFIKYWNIWKQLEHLTSERHELNLHQNRPAHHPLRRLAYLIWLSMDPNIPYITEKLSSLWLQFLSKSITDKTSKQILNESYQLLPIYKDSFWTRHYTFSAPIQNDKLPLLGKSHQKEVMMNIIIPLIFSQCENTQSQEKLVRVLQLVSPTNTSTHKYLKKRFLNGHPQHHKFTNALEEQGAYQIHRDFCSFHETSCINCPLSKAQTLDLQKASLCL